MTISSCPLTGLTLPIPRYVTSGTSRGLGILRLAGLRRVSPLSVWVAGGAGGVSAPAGGGPCHVAGAGGVVGGSPVGAGGGGGAGGPRGGPRPPPQDNAPPGWPPPPPPARPLPAH